MGGEKVELSVVLLTSIGFNFLLGMAWISEAEVGLAPLKKMLKLNNREIPYEITVVPKIKCMYVNRIYFEELMVIPANRMRRVAVAAFN